MTRQQEDALIVKEQVIKQEIVKKDQGLEQENIIRIEEIEAIQRDQDIDEATHRVQKWTEKIIIEEEIEDNIQAHLKEWIEKEENKQHLRAIIQVHIVIVGQMLLVKLAKVEVERNRKK